MSAMASTGAAERSSHASTSSTHAPGFSGQALPQPAQSQQVNQTAQRPDEIQKKSNPEHAADGGHRNALMRSGDAMRFQSCRSENASSVSPTTNTGSYHFSAMLPKDPEVLQLREAMQRASQLLQDQDKQFLDLAARLLAVEADKPPDIVDRMQETINSLKTLLQKHTVAADERYDSLVQDFNNFKVQQAQAYNELKWQQDMAGKELQEQRHDCKEAAGQEDLKRSILEGEIMDIRVKLGQTVEAFRTISEATQQI